MNFKTGLLKKLIRVTTVPVSLKTLLKGQLKFMSQHYEVIGISSAGSEMCDVISNEGIKTRVVEMTRSITPFRDLKSTYHLYRFFKRERPFIVHTHTPKAGTVGMLAAKLAGVHHRIHTIAGVPLLGTNGPKRKLLNIVERFTYACSTFILPNSHGLENIILPNRYTNPIKLEVIGRGSSNGIDVAHYDSAMISTQQKKDLKKELNISEFDMVFIFIGRLVKDKGIDELVLAFDKLSKAYDNIKLIIIGPRDQDFNPISDLSESLIIQNKNIHYVGLQMDVRPYFAISHILTFPSYREGFPNVVLQASCMGLPCIVTDINGCNEIIEHHINGLIIPVKDQESLYEAMKYMIDNPDKRREMSLNCRSRIAENYKQEYVWNSILEFYRSLEKS